MRVIVVAVAAAIAIVQQNRAVRPSDPSFILVLIRARRPTPTSTVAPIRTRHLTPNLARTRGRRPAPTYFTGTPTTGATSRMGTIAASATRIIAEVQAGHGIGAAAHRRQHDRAP